MLVGIPVSLIMALAYMTDHKSEFRDVKEFDRWVVWAHFYLAYLLFAAVGFAGIAGIAMLMKEFR